MTPLAIASRYAADDDALRLELTGEIDLGSVDRLPAAIEEALTGPAAGLIIDLEGVAFLDAAGIAALINARKLAVERGRTYRIVNARGMVRRILDLTGVLAMLTGEPGPPARLAPPFPRRSRACRTAAPRRPR